jgi:hypothetical protein
MEGVEVQDPAEAENTKRQRWRHPPDAAKMMERARESGACTRKRCGGPPAQAWWGEGIAKVCDRMTPKRMPAGPRDIGRRRRSRWRPHLSARVSVHLSKSFHPARRKDDSTTKKMGDVARQGVEVAAQIMA